ncbi:universal stress protein [Dyella sp.]|uniref:universal stress protein n=1 Tax=Dyella sp. TaxID=1869338 RepID=UPI003F7D0E04
MFQHILIATDGSPLSQRAADTGIALAHSLGAKVHAFHAVMPFPAVAYFAEMLLASQAQYTEAALARAHQYLDDVRQRAQAAGVACEASFAVNAHPHEAIIASAREHHCDLIVMASHGRRGVESALLGSETHRTILYGDLPVLVCR